VTSSDGPSEEPQGAPDPEELTAILGDSDLPPSGDASSQPPSAEPLPPLSPGPLDPAGGAWPPSPDGPPPDAPPLTGWRKHLGLIVAGVLVLAIGTGLWLGSGNSGGGGNTAATGPKTAGHGISVPVNTGTPAPILTLGSGSGSSPTKKPKDDKSDYLPYTEFTPSGPQPAAAPAASLPGVAGPDPAVACPASTVQVSTADQLTQALSTAVPGAVIELADGTYAGNFVAKADGTAAQPIFLCGDSGAILDGGSTTTDGYVLHLDGANYWRLDGFTVQDGQKGVVLDHSDENILEHLTVQNTGDEAVHLREFSDDNLVVDNTIHSTGSLDSKFGEGVYIGTAQSNWCTYTYCAKDNSDNNVIRGNNIYDTTAESVDIKEGTTGGALIDNKFDGSAFTHAGATGWVNAKGNDYLIEGNVGQHSYQDGFQTHQILAGWGRDNVFIGNTAIVDGSGFGFHFTPVNGNIWTCNNVVKGAAKGSSNIPCAAAP